jgi:hypothetical protein
VVRLISSNSLKPGVSGRSKWMQIMSACSPMGNAEFFANLQSQALSNCAMSSFVE